MCLTEAGCSITERQQFRGGLRDSKIMWLSLVRNSALRMPSVTFLVTAEVTRRPTNKHHDPQSLRKLYMNYIHAMLEYLHLKLICIPSFEHDIQCTTFATNHIREGEIPNLLSFWVPQKEYEKF